MNHKDITNEDQRKAICFWFEANSPLSIYLQYTFEMDITTVILVPYIVGIISLAYILMSGVYQQFRVRKGIFKVCTFIHTIAKIF